MILSTDIYNKQKRLL